MADYKTVVLTGEEVCVTLSGFHCHLRNLGESMIYASTRSGIVPDADGVLGVPAGAVDMLYDTCGTVYLKGNGKVQLVGSDYADGCLGGKVGDSAVSLDGYIASNPNLLINPDFRINQRGKSEYTYTNYGNKYTLDRWMLFQSGIIGKSSIKITDIGFTKTDTEPAGALIQLLPDETVSFISGKTCTMSAKASTGEIISKAFVYDESYDGQAEIVRGNDNKWYIQFWHWSRQNNGRPCIIAILYDSSITINWVKLELGSVATLFVPPNPATELLKCQRYYERLFYLAFLKANTGGYNDLYGSSVLYAVPKRVSPNIRLLKNDGTENIAGSITRATFYPITQVYPSTENAPSAIRVPNCDELYLYVDQVEVDAEIY